MNTFKHTQLDNTQLDTLFKDIPFYKWLEIHYLDNLSNWSLVSIYQYLESIGFIKGTHKVDTVKGKILKHCFDQYFRDNIGLFKSPRLHEISNMLEFALESTEGAIYLETTLNASNINSGWYTPTGALKITLDSFPTIYGIISKANFNLVLDTGSSYPAKLSLNFKKIIRNKTICSINR
tara:strand:- start:210 stop:746 length:537 start_codon:yes stop_codon:yes gene_type:complete